MQPTIHQLEETTLDNFWKAKPQFTLSAQVRVIDEGLPMAEQMDSSSFRCRNIAHEIFTISTYDILHWFSWTGFPLSSVSTGGRCVSIASKPRETQQALGIWGNILKRNPPSSDYLFGLKSSIRCIWKWQTSHEPTGLVWWCIWRVGCYTSLKQQTATGIVVCLELFKTEWKKPQITTEKK